MSLIRINHQPGRRQLLQFALAWLVFFAALAAILAWKGVSPVWWINLLAAAVLVPVVGSWRPGFLRLVYLGMTYAAWPVGMVVSHVVLAAIYYAVLTPTGLLLRAFKPGFFPKRPDSARESYWLDCHRERTVQDYFKPY